jgi:CHAT domain-containing protein
MIEQAAPQVLHFACHSWFNAAYPSLSGLQLDELLTVEDITGHITLGSGALICLSACRSSISGSGPGDELTGLTQAFLQAGARHVIGSLWLVNDHSTSLFFTEFYRQWAGGGASLSAALRTAVTSVKAAGYRSIFYWAAFQLTGPGR